MCYTIDEIKEKAIPIALNYGIQSLSLFGSYARNEADDNSDVDIYRKRFIKKSFTIFFLCT